MAGVIGYNAMSNVNASGNYTNLLRRFIPRNADGTFENCRIYKRNISLQSNSSGRDAETDLCTEFQYDQNQYRSTLITQMNLVCSERYKSGMFNAAYIIGTLINSAVFSSLIDLYGRRPMYILSCVGLVVSALSAAFIDNVYIFCVVRMLVAFFDMGSSRVSYMIGIELVAPSYRACVGTIFMLSWAAGYMFLAALAYFIRYHVTLQLVIGGLQALVILTLWFIPESPRWLIAKGKMASAEKVCRKISHYNGIAFSSLAEANVCEITHGNHMADKRRDRKTSPLDLLRGSSMRRNSMILFFGWMSVDFVYYTISWNTADMGGDEYMAFFLSGLVEVPAYLLTPVVLEKIGRRFSMSFSMAVSGFLLLVSIPMPETWAGATVGMSVTVKLFITAAYAILYEYTIELYPTSHRALGFGCCFFFSKIGGLLASQILLLESLHAYLPRILLGAFPLVSGVFLLLLPETRGVPLPQTPGDVETMASSSCYTIGCWKKKIAKKSMWSMDAKENEEKIHDADPHQHAHTVT